MELKFLILMKKIHLFVLVLMLIFSCSPTKRIIEDASDAIDFTIAFGSCNRTELNNLLWDDILAANPDIWIWGGDNIYADTDDIGLIQEMYKNQDKIKGYKKLKVHVPIIGTWDDHDYGINDGGAEFHAKAESQQAFLDFMEVTVKSPQRGQEGVYTSHEYAPPNGKVKVIVLDTRYFRTALTLDTLTTKRNTPNAYGEGTILGVKQWQWLEKELKESKADFNFIVSSIQVLSNEHGFECWGNFPHETDKLKSVIANSEAKGVIILSGDRHISEFSKSTVNNLSYPLLDFTSSGLTHTYTAYSGEPNSFRIGTVVFTESFGLVKINAKTKTVFFEMIGNDGEVLGGLQQAY